MPFLNFERKEDIQDGAVVQHLGSAILAPAEALQNLVKKSNELISEHRHWLVVFPQQDTISSTSRKPMTTPPPSLDLRAASPQPQLLSNLLGQDCSSSVSVAVASQGSVLSASIAAVSVSAASRVGSFSSQLGSALSQASQLAGASSQLASANSALASITSSIADLSGGNAIAAESASLAIAAATSSANSLVSAAQASASSANALATSAQSSASRVVSLAEAGARSVRSVADVALESASEILRSASQIVSDAKVTATFSYAMPTITPAPAQTSMAVWQTRNNNVSPSRLALAIVFSIIGSSIASVLAFYFLQRYWTMKKSSKEPDSWKRQPQVYPGTGPREKREPDDEPGIESRTRQRMPDGGQGVANFNEYRYAIDNPFADPSVLVPPLAPLPLDPIRDPPPEPAHESRPRFFSRLAHSVRTVSSLGEMRTGREIRAARRKEEEEREVRRVAVRKVKEGEGRREEERRRRESDDRRLRVRVENEEVERLVGLRRERARLGSRREIARPTRDERVIVGFAR